MERGRERGNAAACGQPRTEEYLPQSLSALPHPESAKVTFSQVAQNKQGKMASDGRGVGTSNIDDWLEKELAERDAQLIRTGAMELLLLRSRPSATVLDTNARCGGGSGSGTGGESGGAASGEGGASSPLLAMAADGLDAMEGDGNALMGEPATASTNSMKVFGKSILHINCMDGQEEPLPPARSPAMQPGAPDSSSPKPISASLLAAVSQMRAECASITSMSNNNAKANINATCNVGSISGDMLLSGLSACVWLDALKTAPGDRVAEAARELREENEREEMALAARVLLAAMEAEVEGGVDGEEGGEAEGDQAAEKGKGKEKKKETMTVKGKATVKGKGKAVVGSKGKVTGKRKARQEDKVVPKRKPVSTAKRRKMKAVMEGTAAGTSKTKAKVAPAVKGGAKAKVKAKVKAKAKGTGTAVERKGKGKARVKGAGSSIGRSTVKLETIPEGDTTEEGGQEETAAKVMEKAKAGKGKGKKGNHNRKRGRDKKEEEEEEEKAKGEDEKGGARRLKRACRRGR